MLYSLPTMTESRPEHFQDWVSRTIGALTAGSKAPGKLESVSGDASFRHYYRVQAGDRSFIAVDAPPENEDSETFVRLSKLFHDAGVCVPKVFAQDIENGFMLLDDFGDDLLLPELREARANQDLLLASLHYKEAIGILLDIQDKVDRKRLDPYDQKELRREMNLFPEWFCEKFLEVDTGKAKQLIEKTFGFLEEAALAQTQVPVHRDFHSRNLMVISSEEFSGHRLGVIDFQDAVLGPYSYDLVSLLRDCYIRWEESQVQEWAGEYLDQALARGILKDVSHEQMLRDFDLMGLQRHLKVMGIFARLAIRDKKPRYLADIPLVIHYFLDVAGRYPELADFLNWFKAELLPRAGEKLNQEF